MLVFLTSATTGDFTKDTRIYERSVGSTNLLLDYWWIGALALIAAVLFFIWKRNSNLVGRLDQRCRAAFADIDAFLAERHALVPNLVEITRNHLAENRDMLDKLLDAQADALEALGDLRMKAETRMGDAINTVVNIAAKAPELRHSEVFGRLREDLTRIEEKITAGRRFYNLTVEEYNSVRRSFPARLFKSRGEHTFFSVGERREELSQPIAISLS